MQESIHCIDTGRYLGVTLETLLTRLFHIDQKSKEVVQILGVLCPLLSRKSGLSIRNGVLLYKQLVRAVMNKHDPSEGPSLAPMSGSRRSINPSVFVLLPTNLLPQIGKWKIHEYLGVLFFADHITALTESFDTKAGGVDNLLFRKLGRYLR
jgi:hypothetical protein